MNRHAAFNETKQLYLEKYGDAMVTGTYLRIAVALLCLIALGLVLTNLKTIRTFQSFRPLVIRIDELGRAEAINYHNFILPPTIPSSSGSSTRQLRVCV